MIYLASPYTDDDPNVVGARVEKTTAETARILIRGIHVFSPIVYGAEMAAVVGKSFEHWKRFDLHMLDIAEELWVLMLPGWESSVGVQEEIDYAKNIGMHIIYHHPTREEDE